MNREIKFRAWDGRYKKMHYKIIVGNLYDKENYTAHCVYLKPGDTDYKTDWPGEWRHFDEHSDFTLLQYTGLKDKNGNEIYEGDILKRSREGNPSFVAVIEFNGGQFGGATYPNRNHFIEMPRLNRCDYDGNGYDEIIGNIYENPELLNNEQEDKRSVATEDQSGNKS